MRTAHLFTLIVAVGYLGARILLGSIRIGGKTRHLFLLGGEFIAVGALLGPRGTNLLTKEVITNLYPVLAMGIGWLGLLIGLQFSREHFSRFPPGPRLAALGIPLLVTAVLWYPLGLLLKTLLQGATTWYAPALVLAATASCTSPTAIALMARRVRRKAETTFLLRTISAFDELPSLLLVGLLYGVLQPRTSAASGLALAVGAPLTLGLLFLLLLRQIGNENELLVVTLGVVTFAGGAAFSATLSPLFSSFLIGVLIANLHAPRRPVFQLIAHTERPFYIVFLILAGAQWDFTSLPGLAIGVGYLILRTLAKLVLPALLAHFFGKRQVMPYHLGLGLLGQGGFSLALALEYTLLFPGQPAEAILGAAIISLMFNQIAAPFGLRLLLGSEQRRVPAREEILA